MTVQDTIQAREITCQGGMPAYLALPPGNAKVPVVINLPERYGYVKHPKDVAERFAREGFIGITPNLFYKYHDQLARIMRRKLADVA